MGDQPRQKLLRVGSENLTTAELVQILVGTGSATVSYKNISRRVLQIVASYGVESQVVILARLLACPGVGEVKASRIVCALELASRLGIKLPPSVMITSTQQAYHQLAFLSRKRQECFVALYLNARQELVYQRTIFVGGVDMSLARPREIFSYAFLKNAFTIILGHNHPSGNPEPSGDDIRTSQHIVQAARWVGVRIVDHLIIGRQGYVSLSKLGYLTV